MDFYMTTKAKITDGSDTSDRRGGSIVPATPSSSSYDGLPRELPARSLAERTSVEVGSSQLRSPGGRGEGGRTPVTRGEKRAKKQRAGPRCFKELRGQGGVMRRRREDDAMSVSSAESQGEHPRNIMGRCSTPKPEAEQPPRVYTGLGVAPLAPPQAITMSLEEAIHAPLPNTSFGGADEQDIPERRGRGRPPTTGKGIGIRERKAEEETRRRERKRADFEREIDNRISRSKIEVSKREGADKMGKIGRERDDPEVVRVMTTTDLAAGVGECLGVITEVARRSSGLQGRMQGSLKRVVDNLQLATSTILKRLAAQEEEPDSLQRQLREMREEMGVLRAENAALRQGMEELRAASAGPSLPQTSPPQPASPTLAPATPQGRTFAEVARSPPPVSPPTTPTAAVHAPPLPQRERRAAARRARDITRAQIKAQTGEGVEYEGRSPVFDDILPEEAPPPHREGSPPAQRPPIRGTSVPLGDYIPMLVEEDRIAYDLVSNKIKRLVEAMDLFPEGEGEKVFSAKLAELTAARAKLEVRGKKTRPTPPPPTRGVPARTPVAENPTHHPSKASPPAPIPASRGRLPEGTGQGGKKRKKKKRKAPPPPVGPNVGPGAQKAQPVPQKGKSGPPTAVASRPPETGTEGQWKVVQRGSKKPPMVGKTAPPQPGATRAVATVPTPPQGGKAPPSKKGEGRRKKAPKAPKSAAVTVACPPGEQAAFMKEARTKISLADLGIEGALKARKALTGALLLEVTGADAGPKADALAGRLQALAAERGEGYLIRRPVKTATIRIRGVEDSLSAEEITAAVAEAGGCRPTDVSVGQLRLAPRGMSTLLVRCPLAAAVKIAAAERIHIGWVRAGVELLTSRPLFCYKCLEQGHVRGSCRSSTDRSSCCYRCGNPGHRAAECAGTPRCLVCEAAGRPSGHKLGGPSCKPPSKAALRRRRRKEAAAAGGGEEAPRPTNRNIVGVSGAGQPKAPPARTPTEENAAKVAAQGGEAGSPAQPPPPEAMEVERLEGVEEP